MKITFIGLGLMGSRMAANLVKSGADVTVYNRTAGKTAALEKAGAKTSTSLQEALKEAELVITMLSRPEVVTFVMLESGLSFMKKNATWIDCSTVNPSFTATASSTAKEFGINYLEAPVAGTTPQAEAAELVFFVGGEEQLLKRVEPFLNMMGSKVLHMGEVGKGASFKMVVNMMLGFSMLAFSESVKLGVSLGLDEEMLLNTVPNLPVSAPFLKMKANLIKEENYNAQFPLELLLKDLHLATLSGMEEDIALPFTEAAQQVYAKAAEEGLGREDMAAVYKM